MRRVLVAPDKFKGSLSAPEVARHLAAGLRQSGVDADGVPVADGGDGTVEAMLSAGYTRQSNRVTGPLGDPTDACWARQSAPVDDSGAGPGPATEADSAAPGGRADGRRPESGRMAEGMWPGRSAGVGLGIGWLGDIAVVELAQASGLVVSPRPLDALRATSHGTGELLRAAREAGCRRIVLGLGGSACTDGGAGMLRALGVRFMDDAGRPVPPGGGGLRDLATVDPAGVPRDWRDVELIVASDVDNPLLGPNGAAAVYGPQKGASASDVAILEAGLARFAEIVARDLGVEADVIPGAGAAGGVGFAALAFLGARIRSGIDLVLSLVDFDGRLDGADVVITGEGRLDSQTVRGKAPAGVASAARRAGVPVIAVAGACELDSEDLAKAGIGAVYTLSDLEPDTTRSMRDAGPLLEHIGTRIAADLGPRSTREAVPPPDRIVAYPPASPGTQDP